MHYRSVAKEKLVTYPVEAFDNVRFHNSSWAIWLVQVTSECCYRVMCRPYFSEPKRIWFRLRLHHRVNRQVIDGLQCPVYHCRYPKWSLLSIPLGDV